MISEAVLRHLIKKLEALEQYADYGVDILDSDTLSYYDGISEGLNQAIKLVKALSDE